jgi:hypothetical protein
VWEELERVIHEGDRLMRMHDYEAAVAIYDTGIPLVMRIYIVVNP